jgi:DNA mismatch endonuclease (patch repair protein)
MVDVVSPEVRSRMMSGIRSKNTKPELLLRRGLHRAGFRYRLHDRSLPGRPDMVFPRRRAVLFAHGCFWHGHNCHLFKWPATREEFWKAKIARNREVDARAEKALHVEGWRQAVVWECALRGKSRMPVEEVFERLAKWLASDRDRIELPLPGTVI